MVIQLVVQIEDKPEKTVNVSKDVIIGRSKTCQFRVLSNDVSREHCKLIVSDEVVAIRDLGSSSGTLVNGKTIPTGIDVLLHPGTSVEVGPLKFQVNFKSKLKVAPPEEAAAPKADKAPAKSSASAEAKAAPTKATGTAAVSEKSAKQKPTSDKAAGDKPKSEKATGDKAVAAKAKTPGKPAAASNAVAAKTTASATAATKKPATDAAGKKKAVKKPAPAAQVEAPDLPFDIAGGDADHSEDNAWPDFLLGDASSEGPTIAQVAPATNEAAAAEATSGEEFSIGDTGDDEPVFDFDPSAESEPVAVAAAPVAAASVANAPAVIAESEVTEVTAEADADEPVFDLDAIEADAPANAPVPTVTAPVATVTAPVESDEPVFGDFDSSDHESEFAFDPDAVASMPSTPAPAPTTAPTTSASGKQPGKLKSLFGLFGKGKADKPAAASAPATAAQPAQKTVAATAKASAPAAAVTATAVAATGEDDGLNDFLAGGGGIGDGGHSAPDSDDDTPDWMKQLS